MEKDFDDERKIFEAEVCKLTKKLSGLATEFLKEQKVKSYLQNKYNLICEERNVLPTKVKELEDINFKVELS